MAAFEDTFVRGENLRLVYSHLLTIKPTSVDSARAFSSASSDDAINELCFYKISFSKKICTCRFL